MKLHQIIGEKHLLCTIINLHFWLYLHLTTSVRCMPPSPFCLKVKLSQVSGNFDTVHGLRCLALGTFEVSKKCCSDFQSEGWLELLLRIFPVVMPPSQLSQFLSLSLNLTFEFQKMHLEHYSLVHNMAIYMK